MTIIVNSKPITICPSHCKKTLHVCTCKPDSVHQHATRANTICQMQDISCTALHGCAERDRYDFSVANWLDVLKAQRRVGGWSEYSVQMVIYRRAISSREAMSLTFFSSVPFIPKKVAISTICLSFTKSFGSEQNFSIVGPKPWQLMPFGMRRPSLHSPLRP